MVHIIIDHIEDIINDDPNFIIEVINNTIVIREEKANAKLKKVTLYGFDDHTFAFKLDAKDKLDIRKTIRISEYLNPNSNKDINRGCDGIIFTSIKGAGYVFICELKSQVPHKSDYIQQFRNTTVFIEFIAAILNEFYGVNLMDHFQIKYILFDKKKKFGATSTDRTQKIHPQKELYDGKELCIYKIHHPNEKKSLDIKRLNLANNSDD
jgi:hypothetical protein